MKYELAQWLTEYPKMHLSEIQIPNLTFHRLPPLQVDILLGLYCSNSYRMMFWIQTVGHL